MQFLSRVLAVALVTSGSAAQVFASDDSEMVIKDNSFLIEEAYNQEPGVMQHIAMEEARQNCQQEVPA